MLVDHAARNGFVGRRHCRRRFPHILVDDRLQCRRLVWLNPLKADPRYEPLARGMAAALPHVDEFLSGHSVASLQELADLLEGGIE